MPKLFLVFLLFVTLDQMAAQCNPPDQLPTPFCVNAPRICLLNACYETIHMPNNGPAGWCYGSNTIENPQYFLFYPTGSPVQIEIHVDYCNAGTSLQAAILDNCPWNIGDVLACNGGTPPGGTIYLWANVLPGQPYWLMFDGSSGSLCNYTITYTDNIHNPVFENDLDAGEAIPVHVCLGADALLVEVYPPIALAHGYCWVLSWSGDTLISTLSSTTIAVPSDINPGIYEICANEYRLSCVRRYGVFG